MSLFALLVGTVFGGSVYLDIDEIKEGAFDPTAMAEVMRVKGILVTNAADVAAQRAVWEPYFMGRVYSVRLHLHNHAATNSAPCSYFTVRDTNGVEYANWPGM